MASRADVRSFVAHVELRPLAGIMFVASVLGGMLALPSGGVSFELVVGVGFNVLFWFWIALGAWRRTTRSSSNTHCCAPADRQPRLGG
ncbi:MAG TPA: hypothetical protein VFZ68_13815 [Acidimicrobiales bacterium]